MKPIENKIWTFLDGAQTIQDSSVEDVRRGKGFLVNDYKELIEHVAQLSFKNPEFVLFFRGQKLDHRDNQTGKTTLYPSIFRGDDYNYDIIFKKRFDDLVSAGERLVQEYPNNFEGSKNIRVYKILRWAILQHYDICLTPLLDITHSIRVASSFAHFDTLNSEEVFIYVLGMPQISGSVTASSEHGIQIIRLLSICPPQAKRPYYQEGYLAGQFPTIGYVEKGEYERNEMDFAQRLICKFRLSKIEAFWDDNFKPIPESYLFPDDRDELLTIANRIRPQFMRRV